VIVLTGAPNVKDANTLFTEGIVEYLMKPVQPEDLVQAVEKAA
jgi:FixJ family two-component response regulator